MERKPEGLRLSASDLVGHHDCHHLTALEISVAFGRLERPRSWSPLAVLLAERGGVHERAFVDHLAGQGLQLVEVSGKGVDPTAVAQTAAAMRSGASVIVQGALSNDRWVGRTDVLWRIEEPSQLGSWSYEAIDAKLSRLTKAGTIIQLSLYSELVGELQGRQPEHMKVVTPWSDFSPESYRVTDFAAYYRLIKARLLAAVDEPVDQTYPEPNSHCELCPWRTPCDLRRRADDHLCFVAGISKLQINELGAHGIQAMGQLAAMPLPMAWKPSRGTVEPYQRVREQARIQVQARTDGQPHYELLPRELGFGFGKLPEPSKGDIFFDLEGDPFIDLGGREYLFGFLFLDEDGKESYRGDWALTPTDEHRAFEAFVDFVIDRWARYPDLHIYHFAPYEPSALKRLMSRYATCEEEVDRMLRAQLFVDLYPTTKRAIRASVESYSIKNLEQFCGFKRAVSLDDANRHLAIVQSSLEFGDLKAIPTDSLVAVAGYNRDDCASARALRDWLEGLRAKLIDAGETIVRPPKEDGEASEAISLRQQRVRALMDRLLENVPPAAEDRQPSQQALWTLAHVLDWHRREDKVVWWEFFRLADLDLEELLDERAALSGLVFVGRIAKLKAPIDRYSFPPQETDIRGDEDLRVYGGAKLGKVEAISLDDRTIDIKKMIATADLHPVAVFTHKKIPNDGLADSLFRIGAWVADHGLTGEGDYLAARDLLLRCQPRLGGAPIENDHEPPLDAARRIARSLDGGIFPIQGPPGSGKTFIGARMICELVRAGRKVGVTATSHKVVRNLLEEAVKASKEEGLDLQTVERVRKGDEGGDCILAVTDNKGVLDALEGGVKVAGGTAWLWAPPESAGAVDVLVVDEAAQMSLANVLAVSQAARAVVLLGDPNQLEQPQQGSQPDGTGISALDHVLAGGLTIPPDRGLFLSETWRLHPAISEFTSEQFYEGRLNSRPGLERQAIHGNGLLDGSGLRVALIEHDGNQTSSIEEAGYVDRLVRSLLDNKASWTDKDDVRRPLELKDILVIAPYNAQVFELKQRLPEGARVGTVDKFQGQEAPLVIYSMTTSDPENAPRGMEFLYSLNRLNVATSRARCMCLIVASPRVFEPDCRSPRQMKLANAYCRYLEVATRIVAN